MVTKIKNAFKKENLFYTLIFIISMAVIITNRAIVGFPPVLWLCDIGSIFSILYTINMAKHNVYGFVFNIIATAVMVVTGYYQHIWLNATVCLTINIPSMIIGLIGWLKNEKSGKEDDNLKHMSKRSLWIMITLSLVVAGVFTYILYLLDGNLFYIDGIFSALCVMGVVLASKMYIEQYFFFMPANIIGIILYVILCFQDMSNLPYVITNIIFTIVSFMGYANWKKLSHNQSCKTENCETCLKNEEKLNNYPLFSLNEVENAVLDCFGKDNCYRNNDDNLSIYGEFINTFTAVDHWCECEVSVVYDKDSKAVYLSDACHTFINFTDEGLNYETESYFAYQPLVKKLIKKYPHIDFSCGEIRARVTSLDKEDLLRLASDVVSATYSIWHFLHFVVNAYKPCEQIGEGEYKDLTLEQAVNAFRLKGEKVLFDNKRRLYYIKKSKPYYLVYTSKGYKFSTLQFEKIKINISKLKKVEYDFDKCVSVLTNKLGDRFNLERLSYTTLTYVDGKPIKFYLQKNKHDIYFSDKKWAKNKFPTLNLTDLAFTVGVGISKSKEICVGFADVCDEAVVDKNIKNLIYSLEVAALRIKDLDVYSLENLHIFDTYLRNIEEVESLLNPTFKGRWSEGKVYYSYSCPFCERSLDFRLEMSNEYCAIKFDSFLQGDNFDIYANLVKDKGVYYSKSDNTFCYNILGKSTYTTQKECYDFIEFLLLHNLLERVDKVTCEGGQMVTEKFINEKVSGVINSLAPLFNLVNNNGSVSLLRAYRMFNEGEEKLVGEQNFKNITCTTSGITSSLVEEALKSGKENLIYLVNNSTYFNQIGKENFETLFKDVVMLCLVVKNLI